MQTDKQDQVADAYGGHQFVLGPTPAFLIISIRKSSWLHRHSGIGRRNVFVYESREMKTCERTESEKNKKNPAACIVYYSRRGWVQDGHDKRANDNSQHAAVVITSRLTAIVELNTHKKEKVQIYTIICYSSCYDGAKTRWRRDVVY